MVYDGQNRHSRFKETIKYTIVYKSLSYIQNKVSNQKIFCSNRRDITVTVLDQE